MHNIEKYGGRRIHPETRSVIRVQFPNAKSMDQWLTLMRSEYSGREDPQHPYTLIPCTFYPYINREAFIVSY